MKNYSLLFCFFSSFCFGLWSQNLKPQTDPLEECGLETASRDAEILVDQLLSYMSEKRDFVLVKCNGIDNAEALSIIDENGNLTKAQAVASSELVDGKRVKYLKYDEDWLLKLASEDEYSFNWAAVGVFAHELGHLVKGHTTTNRDSLSVEENHRLELEADIYMGSVLARMGAFEEEAISAFASLTDSMFLDSKTHPLPSERRIYARVGYDLIRKAKKPDEVLKKDQITKYSPDNRISSSVPIFMRHFDSIGASFDINEIKQLQFVENVQERKIEWSLRQQVDSFQYSYEIFSPSIYKVQWNNPQTRNLETYVIANNDIYHRFNEGVYSKAIPSNGTTTGDAKDDFLREINPYTTLFFEQLNYQTSSELTTYVGRKRFYLPEFSSENILPKDCWVVELPEEQVVIGDAPFDGKLIRISTEQYFDINSGLLVGIIENRKTTEYKNHGRKRQNSSLMTKTYLADYKEDKYSCVKFPHRCFVMSVKTVDGFELPRTKMLQLREIDSLNTNPRKSIRHLIKEELEIEE